MLFFLASHNFLLFKKIRSVHVVMNYPWPFFIVVVVLISFLSPLSGDFSMTEDHWAIGISQLNRCTHSASSDERMKFLSVNRFRDVMAREGKATTTTKKRNWIELNWLHTNERGSAV